MLALRFMGHEPLHDGSKPHTQSDDRRRLMWSRFQHVPARQRLIDSALDDEARRPSLVMAPSCLIGCGTAEAARRSLAASSSNIRCRDSRTAWSVDG